MRIVKVIAVLGFSRDFDMKNSTLAFVEYVGDHPGLEQFAFRGNGAWKGLPS